ncbi:hypothetical protein GCM10009754_70240 [Amycolatopsis minnesotensis]|uniref:Uncharacterized protein n=1 Tax=Amycolatopsis minnesotensis TaxID=337894 RepID=A0ABP5DMZ1_9PSEU
MPVPNRDLACAAGLVPAMRIVIEPPRAPPTVPAGHDVGAQGGGGGRRERVPRTRLEVPAHPIDVRDGSIHAPRPDDDVVGRGRVPCGYGGSEVGVAPPPQLRSWPEYRDGGTVVNGKCSRL